MILLKIGDQIFLITAFISVVYFFLALVMVILRKESALSKIFWILLLLITPIVGPVIFFVFLLARSRNHSVNS